MKKLSKTLLTAISLLVLLVGPLNPAAAQGQLYKFKGVSNFASMYKRTNLAANGYNYISVNVNSGSDTSGAFAYINYTAERYDPASGTYSYRVGYGQLPAESVSADPAGRQWLRLSVDVNSLPAAGPFYKYGYDLVFSPYSFTLSNSLADGVIDLKWEKFGNDWYHWEGHRVEEQGNQLYHYQGNGTSYRAALQGTVAGEAPEAGNNGYSWASFGTGRDLSVSVERKQ